MLAYLAGVATLGYLVAAGFFVRFWRRTSDRLFLHFALAFALLAVNQTLAHFLGADNERIAFVYLLRVLAFALILVAILDKSLFSKQKRK